MRRKIICLQKWKFLSIHWWWDLLDQTTEVCQLFHLSQSWKKKKNCRSFEIVTLPYIWSCLDIISPNLEKRYLRNVKMKVIWLDQRPIEWFFHPFISIAASTIALALESIGPHENDFLLNVQNIVFSVLTIVSLVQNKLIINLVIDWMLHNWRLYWHLSLHIYVGVWRVKFVKNNFLFQN